MTWKIIVLYTVLLCRVSTEYCEESLSQYLPDSAFSSSSSYTSIRDGLQYDASRGKMVGDKPGSWIAETVDNNQFIQIDLLRVSLVTQIVTKGRNIDVYTGCCQQYVTSYFVEYSTNNKTWTQTTTSSNINVFSGNTNTEDAVTNKLGCPAIARYIRILPQTWHGHIALRVDIRGCYIQTDTITPGQMYNEAVYPQLRDVNSTFGRSWFHNLYSQSNRDGASGLSDQLLPSDSLQPSSNTRVDRESVVNNQQLTSGFYNNQQTSSGFPSSNTRVDQGSIISNQPPPSWFNNNPNPNNRQRTSGYNYQQPTSGFNNQQPTSGFNYQQRNTGQKGQSQSKNMVVDGTVPSLQQAPIDNPYQQGNRDIPRQTTTQPWFARDWDPSVFKNREESFPPWRRTNWGNEYPFPQEGVIAPRKNDRCIESCYNRRDGDYQSCRSCRVYVSCSNGYTYDQRLCPGNLVWNDDTKICDWTSETCP